MATAPPLLSIDEDLHTIEATLRNQYRLAQLKHNGAFHHLELISPTRVETLTVRTGYYAPSR